MPYILNFERVSGTVWRRSVVLHVPAIKREKYSSLQLVSSDEVRKLLKENDPACFFFTADESKCVFATWSVRP